MSVSLFQTVLTCKIFCAAVFDQAFDNRGTSVQPSWLAEDASPPPPSPPIRLKSCTCYTVATGNPYVSHPRAYLR